MGARGRPEDRTASRMNAADRTVLFVTRGVRMFAYGLLAVVLVLYLVEVGLTERQVGVLLTLTLLGDTAISLWMTAVADRIGRRRMLIAGAGLMVGAGLVFAVSRDWLVLAVAATLGVISPSGGEVGPFLAIEQASLSEIVATRVRTRLFAWYNLTGSFALALGSLAGGLTASGLQRAGFDTVASYRVIVACYAALGLVLALLFTRLSTGAEPPAGQRARATPGSVRRVLGLAQSQRVVFRLAALFALDAFAGAFIIQSIVAYWFHVRFGVSEAMLGGLLFGANLLAGVSALVAVRLAARIGLLRTMVFTHIPSNVLLMLVPLMPTAAARHAHAARPLQHLADGRADAPVLCRRARRPGRTFGRRRRDRRRAQRRRRDLAVAHRRAAESRGPAERAVPAGGRPEDRVRPHALPQFLARPGGRGRRSARRAASPRAAERRREAGRGFASGLLAGEREEPDSVRASV